MINKKSQLKKYAVISLYAIAIVLTVLPSLMISYYHNIVFNPISGNHTEEYRALVYWIRLNSDKTLQILAIIFFIFAILCTIYAIIKRLYKP